MRSRCADLHRPPVRLQNWFPAMIRGPSRCSVTVCVKLAVHAASLLEDGIRRPAHVFVSASPVVPRDRFLHKLDDAAFIRAIASRFGALPAQITDDPEIWDLFARPPRADLEALETDEQPQRRLDIALTVISGSRDTVVTGLELRGWREWSSSPVHFEALDADHFCYRTQPQQYLGVIVKRLFANAI
jgi:surfactin synthase thioesterase subunit